MQAKSLCHDAHQAARNIVWNEVDCEARHPTNQQVVNEVDMGAARASSADPAGGRVVLELLLGHLGAEPKKAAGDGLCRQDFR